MKTDRFIESGIFGLFLPPIVLKKNELNSTERLLLMIISALDKSRKGCYLSNAQLAWISGCSPGTVSRSIKKMCRLKYIITNKQSIVNGGRCYMRKVAEDIKRKPE